MKLNEKIIIRKIDKETIFVNMRTGMAVTLDEVGSRMFEEFVNNYDYEKTCDILCKEYDVDIETLKKDLIEVERILREHEIIIDSKR